MKTASKPQRAKSIANVPGIRIRPLNNWIVVEYEESEKKTASGRLYIPEVAQKPSYEAIVIAVGPGRWSEKLFDRLPMGVKPGDKISVTPQNYPVTIDGREVYWVREEEVLGHRG